MNKHIMETINQLNKFTKTSIVFGLILMLYGYMCRIFGLYFFWESKSLGWTLLFVGLIGFLAKRVEIKTTEKKTTLLEKIGIGIIILIILIRIIIIVVIPSTDAYSVAKKHLINNAILENEVGNINSFGLISTGSIQKNLDSSGEYGNAIINLTVKGDKKFKDISIYVVKYIDKTNWEVERIE